MQRGTLRYGVFAEAFRYAFKKAAELKKGPLDESRHPKLTPEEVRPEDTRVLLFTDTDGVMMMARRLYGWRVVTTSGSPLHIVYKDQGVEPDVEAAGKLKVSPKRSRARPKSWSDQGSHDANGSILSTLFCEMNYTCDVVVLLL